MIMSCPLTKMIDQFVQPSFIKMIKKLPITQNFFYSMLPGMVISYFVICC